ncbi:hypothetical protein QL285_067527 [Trifolium repens]|nr:hypothetical protein QL285_067527 [Trifolium repens]
MVKSLMTTTLVRIIRMTKKRDFLGLCYECGKSDHYIGLPKSQKEGQIKVSQKSGGKGRRAYIIWECESDSSKAIRLTPEDSEKTTFTTDADNYYKVMHFGLKNIDATYQRMMNKVFKNQIYMSHAGSIHERHDC